MADVAGHERRVGLQADAGLHRVTYVDPFTGRAQAAQHSASADRGLPRELQARHCEQHVGIRSVLLVISSERKLEGRHGCNPEGKALADTPNKFPAWPYPAQVVDQDIGI